MSPSRPACPAESLLQQSGHCNSARTECRPEGMHWSAQDAARALVSRILLRKPEDRAQRSRLRVEGSSQTATEKLGEQSPPDVSRWCPHATRGHDTQVLMTRSASARDLSSDDKDKAASLRYGPKLTERWGPRSRRRCQRPHTELIAILPARELTLAHAHSEL